MTKNKKITFWEIIGFIFIIVAIVSLYLISIGKIDLFDKTKKTEIEPKPQVKKVATEKLKREKEEKQTLKKKLDRRSILVFNFVKYSLAALFLVANVFGWIMLWSGDFHETLSNLVSYNEAVFIIYLFLMLVIPRKPLSLSSLSFVLKRKIRKLFYREYPGLEDEIKQLEKEIERYTIPNYSKLHPHG